MSKTKPTPLYSFNDKSKPLKEFLSKKNKKEDVEIRRKYIYDVLSHMMDNKVNRIDCYRNEDIEKAIDLYDELILGNCLRNGGYTDKKVLVGSIEDEHEIWKLPVL